MRGAASRARERPARLRRAAAPGHPSRWGAGEPRRAEGRALAAQRCAEVHGAPSPGLGGTMASSDAKNQRVKDLLASYYGAGEVGEDAGGQDGAVGGGSGAAASSAAYAAPKVRAWGPPLFQGPKARSFSLSALPPRQTGRALTRRDVVDYDRDRRPVRTPLPPLLHRWA